MDRLCETESVLPVLEHASQLRQSDSRPARAVAKLLGPSQSFASGLAWWDCGVGWYPVTGQPYNGAYFEKYCGYGRTKMGRDLNKARLDFVGRYYPAGMLCDVGIGSGS